MKRFLSTNYTENSFNLSTLLLRLTFGGLICVLHGIGKLTHFSAMAPTFFDPMHIGHKLSLALVVFAEVFCALLLVLGLFSRFAALVLVINLGIAAFLAHQGQPLTAHEPAFTYLAAFVALLLVGPGRISVDAMMGK
jgi:putative oxidoreductase